MSTTGTQALIAAMLQLDEAKRKVKIEHQLIGEARKTERVTKGLSLRKQAIQLGVSKSQLWAMEKGIRKWKVQN
jgi:hypothetical protein